MYDWRKRKKWKAAKSDEKKRLLSAGIKKHLAPGVPDFKGRRFLKF
jgi:hypothetical protein